MGVENKEMLNDKAQSSNELQNLNDIKEDLTLTLLALI
jgi:hypothetical protein